MDVKVKAKIFGKKDWVDKTLKLPEFCAPYLEKFNIEIVEYKQMNCMGIFFQKKEEPTVDFWSHTIQKPGILGNIVQGFKEAFEGLELAINPKQEEVEAEQNDKV
jgi:hypothetical protein